MYWSIHMNSVLFQIEQLIHSVAGLMVSFFHPNILFFSEELGIDIKFINRLIVVFYLNLKIKPFHIRVTVTLNSTQFVFMAVNLSIAFHSFLFKSIPHFGEWFLQVIHQLIDLDFSLINTFGVTFSFYLHFDTKKEWFDAPDGRVQILFELFSVLWLLRVQIKQLFDWK
jgi:hypothetical protein